MCRGDYKLLAAVKFDGEMKSLKKDVNLIDFGPNPNLRTSNQARHSLKIEVAKSGTYSISIDQGK